MLSAMVRACVREGGREGEGEGGGRRKREREIERKIASSPRLATGAFGSTGFACTLRRAKRASASRCICEDEAVLISSAVNILCPDPLKALNFLASSTWMPKGLVFKVV